jgi:glycerol-1-phosphate dehydrogenase [NAD(P)+]
VGVGTLIMCAAYQYIREIDPAKIDPRSVLRRRPPLAAIEAENNRLYADKAEPFNVVARDKRIPDADLPGYIRRIQDGWGAMWQAVDPYIAPLERIAIPFAQAGVPSTLAEIQRTPEQAREALLHGSHYRPRYTLLDLLWELGLFPAAADEILERARVV